jgi:hypothetical protein
MGGFPWLWVQDVKSFILVGALFLLDGGRNREGKNIERRKKNQHGKEGSPETGPPC